MRFFSNKSARPAPTPACSLPAMGWAGMKNTPSGIWGVMASIAGRFTEQTSITMQPALSAGAISSMTSSSADGGQLNMMRSLWATDSLALVVNVSANSCFFAKARDTSFGSQTVMWPHTFFSWTARAIELPISPRPMMVMRSKTIGNTGYDFMNWLSVSTTARLSSSNPILMRRYSGRP